MRKPNSSSGGNEEKSIIISPYDVFEPVLIKAITNLHPGIGRTGEVIDLPVQKDSLGFPIIYSSSLKGALKSALWRFDEHRSIVTTLLGPEPEEGEKFTSAIAILDAFTLAFPVRSLEGVYAFATSPLILKRFNELLIMVNKQYKCVSNLLNLSISNGICKISQKAENTLKIEALNKKIIINEEIDLEYEIDESNNINQLEKLLNIEQGRLIILNDNDALHALERSLIRVTRIAVNREKKIVRTGALWIEEYIPWGTIFVTAFFYTKAKKADSDLQSGEAVKSKLHELLNKIRYYLIIGGNETIGRGIVRLEFKGDEKEV